MPVGEFSVAKKLIPEYDQLYARALALMKKYNPCAVSDGTCLRGRNGGANFCCSGCSKLSSSGCTVEALQCKLWYCDYSLLHESIREDFKREMWEIFIDAEALNLLVSRGSKVDSIRHACDIAMKKKKEDKLEARRAHTCCSSGYDPVPPRRSLPSLSYLLDEYKAVAAKPVVEKPIDKVMGGMNFYGALAEKDRT